MQKLLESGKNNMFILSQIGTLEFFVMLLPMLHNICPFSWESLFLGLVVPFDAVKEVKLFQHNIQ
jgi:hypothetical protein